MRTSQFTQAVVVLATASQSFAQTFSKCDPTKKTGCANNPALPASLDSDFGAATIPPNWIKIESQGSITKENGASSFIVGKQNDSPTADTTGYALFGSFSVEMKAAPGVGIVSSIVLESDNLDEVDWELIGGNNTHIQTNYFGKGDTSTYDRAVWHPIADPQANFHTYTVTWTQDKILWIIDDVVVRSLAYKDAKGGSRFPQTPMRLRLGSWAGGDPTNGQGTIEWAGGKTDFSKAPFAMVVRRVSITNYSPGKEYQWTDQSGSFDSIKVVDGKLGGESSPSDDTPLTTSTAGATKASQVPTIQLATEKPSNITGTSSASKTSSSSSATSTSAIATVVSAASSKTSASSPAKATGAAAELRVTGAMAGLLGLGVALVAGLM